jgi:hypothetical protein
LKEANERLGLAEKPTFGQTLGRNYTKDERDEMVKEARARK